MSADEEAGGALRDSEIAIVDALKILIEAMIGAGAVKREEIAQLLEHQRDGYIAKRMANAAVVMEVLRTFARNSAPDPGQEALRKALEKPPQGSA